MGRKSEAIQYYGVGVPYGQRPSSAPGVAPTQRFMTISAWQLVAEPNALEVGSPADVARQLGTSEWRFEAAASPIVVLSPDAIQRDLAASEWQWIAESSGIEAADPEAVERDLTRSEWHWVAESNPIATTEYVCCDRLYRVRGGCLVYETVCCRSEDVV